MSRCTIVAATLAGLLAAPLAGQTVGQIAGQVRDTAGVPLPNVEVTLDGGVQRLTTDRRGEFVFVAVPPGVHRVSARLIGYRVVEITDVAVQSGAFVRLDIRLEPSAVPLEPLAVRGERQALVAPDVNATRETVGRQELATLPVQTVAEVVDLAVGVSDGRFRGGRLGQAAVAVDGVDVKNPFAAQTGGPAFEFSPSALQEVALSTAGFGPEHGAALAGVVQLVTRTGPGDRWTGSAEWLGDDPAPTGLSRGYARLGLSAGGPLRAGTTLFADLALTGLADAEPRLEGLACLDAQRFCFQERRRIPHQRGDRYTALLKLDQQAAAGGVSLLLARNRDQHELYSTRFKYNLDGYLAERQTSTLVSATGRWLFQPSPARALLASAKVALVSFDEYIGVPERDQPGGVARFRLADLRFRGETEARAGRVGLPGYAQPLNSGRSTPYGFLGSDLFVDGGTSGVAAWSRSRTWDLGAQLQAVLSPQHEIQAGADLKLHRIERYETTRAWSPAAGTVQADVSPRTIGAFVVNKLRTRDGLTVDLGVRLEGFQPRIDTAAGFAPTEWTTLALPRVGVAAPLGIVGLDRVVARFNFGRYAQPPDFRFLFDTELDDSLNTALRRQGNPTLGFERAIAYEGGLGVLLGERSAIHVVGYFKELTGITTSAIGVGGFGAVFTNLDFGTSKGVEARVEATWGADRRVRAGYALSKTVAVVSSVFDSVIDPTAPRVEVPLQFDRRHVIDVDALWGVAGPLGGRLQAALAGSVGSGSPVPGDVTRRLPWSAALTARLTHVRPWRGGELTVFIEARNVLGFDNLRAARRSGGVDPDVAELDERARAETALNDEFPQESPFYIPRFDLDGDGYVGTFEQYQARRAALLDLFEPTLLYGEARTIRLGVRWAF